MKALGQSLVRSFAILAVSLGLLFTPAAQAGPISLSIRVQKEFFKAQAVTTTRVVTCFKTDPNTGVQTMGLCTEAVTEQIPTRVPAASPPPPVRNNPAQSTTSGLRAPRR